MPAGLPVRLKSAAGRPSLALVLCTGVAAFWASETLAGVPAREAAPPAAAGILPERTLAVFVAEDIAATVKRFRETNVYRLWREKEVQDFFKPLTEGFDKLYRRGEELLDFSYADLLNAFRGQAVLAFVGVKGAADGQVWPEAAALAEVSDHAAAARLVERLSRAVEEAGGPAVQTMRFGPVTIGRLAEEGVPLEVDYVLAPGALYVTIGPNGGILSELARAAWGRAGSGALAGEEDFLRALQKAGGRRDLFSYLAYARTWRERRELRKGVVALLAYAGGARGARRIPPLNEKQAARVDRLHAALGLDGVRSISFAEAVDVPGFRSQVYVHAPVPRKGLFELLPEEPVRRDMLALAPADSSDLLALRLRLDRLLPVAREAARAVGADALQQVDRVIAMVRDMTGIDLEREVLGGLFGGQGGEVMVFNAPLGGTWRATGLAGFATRAAGLTVVVRAARPEAFGTFYEKLVEIAIGYAIVQGTEIVEETTPEGAQLRYVGGPVGTTPTVTYFEGHLVAGATKQAVARVCAWLGQDLTGDDRDGESFASSADYEKALARAGVTPGFMLGHQAPTKEEDLKQPLALAPAAKPILMQRAARARLPRELQDIIKMTNLAEMPSAETLAGYSLPQIWVGWSEDEGVALTSWTSSGVITPATVVATVGAAAAAPRIERAMQRAERNRCMENLHRVRSALQRHAAEHRDRFPEKLEELVPKYLPDAAFLACPTTGRQYAYVSGLRTSDSPNTIIVYELPPGHRGGLNILYVGRGSHAHVTWQRRPARIQRRVEVQMRQLRAQGRTVRVVGAPDGTEPVVPDDDEEFF